MSEYVQCYRYFSETKVSSKEFVHTWKINNFQAVHPGIGKYINIGRYKKDVWYLELYADGKNNTYKDYVGMFIYFHKELIQTEHRPLNDSPYLFSIYLVDKNKKEHELYKSTSKPEEMHISELINKNDLFNEKNEWLPNGNLILRFKVYYPGEIVEESTQISSCTCASNPKLNGFENMFNKEKFSDVKIAVGDKVFWAYKGILANRSPVFAAMFEYDMKENKENTVEIADIDHDVVEEMLRFIYIGKVNNIETIARDLLAAADKYEIEDLKLICEKTLIKDLNLETVIGLLILAEKCGAKLLKENALDFFKLHAKEIVQSDKCKADLKSLVPVLSEIITSLAL